MNLNDNAGANLQTTLLSDMPFKDNVLSINIPKDVVISTCTQRSSLKKPKQQCAQSDAEPLRLWLCSAASGEHITKGANHSEIL